MGSILKQGGFPPEKAYCIWFDMMKVAFKP
jgi:hypothetical protein